MAFWNKGKKLIETKAAEFPIWDQAKLITENQSLQENLSLGWYLYKKGYRWFTLKPNDTNTAFVKGYGFHTALEAQEWLGIPVPPELMQAKENKLSINDLLLQALAKAENENIFSIPSINTLSTDKKIPNGKESKNPSRVRPFEAHIRFSESEQRLLERRIDESGLPKGVFLRKSALETQIVVANSKEKIVTELKNITTELKNIHTELGRQGGMLKMVINPNKGQREFHPEEWNTLIQMNHRMVKNQRIVEKVMEAILEYLKTQQF